MEHGMKLLSFFKPAPHRPVVGTREELATVYRRRRQQAVFVMVVVYGLYYVCRLSLNVMKKPMVDSGYLTTEQLGCIGSALFFAYAVGKCVNGFLADRCDIRKFMSVGLFISALANFALGFRMPALFFAALWGINGYARSPWARPRAWWGWRAGLTTANAARTMACGVRVTIWAKR